MSFKRPLVYLVGVVSLASALVAPRAMAVDAGPKGLFFEQLQKPKEPMNTGLRYWIELVRKGQTTKVTNKFQFTSGDRIRFHVRPNIDGYAYILLSSGSRGEQSVLFPDPKIGEDNHVSRGQEYELPSEGYLRFDENPGTEKVTLLLSRNTMDAQAFLDKPSEPPAIIASAMIGSKDLVPAQVVIAYNPPKHDMPVQIASKPEKEKVTAPKSHSKKSSSKPAPVAAAPNETETATVELHSAATSKTPPRSHSSGLVPVSFNKEDDGITTVVKKDPTGVLYIDMTLDHR